MYVCIFFNINFIVMTGTPTTPLVTTKVGAS